MVMFLFNPSRNLLFKGQAHLIEFIGKTIIDAGP